MQPGSLGSDAKIVAKCLVAWASSVFGSGLLCFLITHLLLAAVLLRKLKAICQEKSTFLMLSSDKVTLFDGCTQSVGGRHHIPCTALEWLHLTNKRVLN